MNHLLYLKRFNKDYFLYGPSYIITKVDLNTVR